MKVVFHHEAGTELVESLAGLAEQGLEVTVVPVSDREAFTRELADAEALWHVLEPVTAAHIAGADRLRLIQKIGVGVNTIDIEAAQARSIAVCNMPGTNSQAVAEMTLMLMLAALRRAAWFDRRTRAGEGWSFPAAVQDDLGEIAGKTVGFVGFGEVPRHLAPVLQALGARLLYTATKPKPAAAAEWRDFDALLSESDILSLHIPLTETTAGLLDAAAFARMKPGAVLVNTARGGIVDQPALTEALRSGRLRAAGLDVFAEEPIAPDDPLLTLNNVVLAPHVAWLTRETLERSIAVAVENCRRLGSGGALLHRVA